MTKWRESGHEASNYSSERRQNYGHDFREFHYFLHKIMKSLLYISRSLLTLPTDEVEIGCIVAVARSRNAALGVTGTLIATNFAFAQILEGEKSAVDEIMRSIYVDNRHTDIRVLEYREIGQRKFQGWALAYSGSALYIGGRLARLAAAEAGPLQITQLVDLLEEFGRHTRRHVQQTPSFDRSPRIAPSDPEAVLLKATPLE